MTALIERDQVVVRSKQQRGHVPRVATSTASGALSTYTVTAADTLSGIGVRFGVDWMRIAAANGIAGSNYLVRDGQTLTIPAR